MRYKVGDTFRFKGLEGFNAYKMCKIVEVKPSHYDGPFAIWFKGTGSISGLQWVGSGRFDNPKDDWYGIITSNHKEFTDEEYEELLV